MMPATPQDIKTLQVITDVLKQHLAEIPDMDAGDDHPPWTIKNVGWDTSSGQPKIWITAANPDWDDEEETRHWSLTLGNEDGPLSTDNPR